MDEDSSIREIKGIGEKTEALFQKLGVNTREIFCVFIRGPMISMRIR